MINLSKNKMVRLSQESKRGFTLTEIAIVLGVIGLILGSIWVAAAAVYNNMRVSTATRELLSIAQAVRSLYATSATVSAAANMTVNGVQQNGAATYAQAGVFDADMVTGTIAAGYTVQGPWTNGAVAVVSATSVGGVNGDSFAIEFDAVPTAACIQMLINSTGSSRDPGMVGAGAGAAGALSLAAGGTATAAQQALPLSAATAQGQCANALNNVFFQFKLKG